MPNDVRSTVLYRRALGCLMGGLIGDAMGEPAEGKDYGEIEERFGWITDFDCDGTDDTMMKYLLAEALVRTDGYATRDDWAMVWLDGWDTIFGAKESKFFISVRHTARKLKYYSVPRMAALGNMPSSSSAMCISPVGIVNACNPRQAAFQAYNLASLIHIYDAGFCQDGAAAMAASVAEAFRPGASVGSVLSAATEYIERLSGREMLGRIGLVLKVARETNDYHAFREAAYLEAEKFFRPIVCDSRETVPIALALFYLAEGDVERCVTYGANFGRDADTIASMAGAIAGALQGVEGIRRDWLQKANRYASIDQEDLAAKLVEVALKKCRREREAQNMLDEIAS